MVLRRIALLWQELYRYIFCFLMKYICLIIVMFSIDELIRRDEDRRKTMSCDILLRSFVSIVPFQRRMKCIQSLHTNICRYIYLIRRNEQQLYYVI